MIKSHIKITKTFTKIKKLSNKYKLKILIKNIIVSN